METKIRTKTRQLLPIAAGVLLLAHASAATTGDGRDTVPTVDRGSRPTVPMQHAQVRLEYNATDDDAEAVIVVDAGIGFTRLAIFGPSGKLMHEIRAQNGGVGLTKMPMETPEPSLEEVEAAYPEGTYRFRGRTVDGSALTGEAIVSHALLAPATITAPVADASDVAVADLTVSWQPVAGATSYLIELEDDAVPAAVKADLPGAASSFTFSGGWLRPDTSYVLTLGAVGANGNVVYSEIRFRTRA